MIECVFWLQSGARYGEKLEPDDGPDAIGVEYTVPVWLQGDTYADAIGLNEVEDLPHALSPRRRELVFRLTEDPEAVSWHYAIGRRRFHYRETSGWMTADERMARDLERPGQREHERRSREWAKQVALLKTGGVPVSLNTLLHMSYLMFDA